MPKPDRKKAFASLDIRSGDKAILSLDGGGIRGIFTLQMLKKIEEIAGMPCYDLFDMVAGTSTGGIIAGLIACGKTAAEIETLYINLVTKVFLKRNFLANRFINPPLYDKKNYRNILKKEIENITLQQACSRTSIDLLITAKDISASEETFFTCFNKGGEWEGTYKDVLLRGVLEATMSAPTYFFPLERFVDGGTTTYNNPSLAAIIEATCYSGKDKYVPDQITLFSLGTGTTVKFVKPEDTLNPSGVDVHFWLNYVMDEAGQDASDMQLDTLRCGFVKGLDFRRFQFSLDEQAVSKLPNRDISKIDEVEADWIRNLTNEELGGIDLDDVRKFALMKQLGEAVVDYICPPNEAEKATDMRQGNWFKKDLKNERGRDELVTALGDVERIKKQMSDPNWLDNYKS